MGQYAAAFRLKPVLAYKHKAFIFWRHHDDIFPPDVRVEEVLFQWICGEIARETVQSVIQKKRNDETRILKKGGTLFVLAAMTKILFLRNGATYLNNCSENVITSKNSATKLKKYAQYACNTYIQAVVDQKQLENNELSTLIRQPEFFDKVIERVIRQYEKDTSAAQWLKEAIPVLNLKK